MSDIPSSRLYGDQLLRLVARWCILLGAVVFGLTFFSFAVYAMIHEEWVEQAAKEHFAATVGLPCAALASLLLVSILEFNNGNVEMKGFGLEFKGAAGPVIMWMFSFLAMAGAIRLLW